MARRFQTGSIETSGKWFVVRYWVDQGDSNRRHACSRICPIEGPGKLSKTERLAKANQIITEAGVNDASNFVPSPSAVTFAEQAEMFLSTKMASKRKPIKPATLCTFRSIINRLKDPKEPYQLGDIPLSAVNNAVLKKLVADLTDKKKSAKTIVNYTGLVKLVVSSAIDSEGEELYPRKWNSEFMDLPIVTKQHQPTLLADSMTKLIAAAEGTERMLFALLAGSGLRAGEALGLDLSHLSGDYRTISVKQSNWNNRIQAPKTLAAVREIDLCSTLSEMLRDYVGDRQTGLLFLNSKGRALSQSNVLRRGIHPLLKKIGVERMGFHAFRRFRTTHLEKQDVPGSLLDFWIGHSDSKVTARYLKLKKDVSFRLEVAERVGLGYEIQPSPVRNGPQLSTSEGTQLSLAPAAV